MFCASNDTTLVGYGLACSEKPFPNENGSKSWNSPECNVNAIEIPKLYFYDFLRLQCHCTRLIWTRLFVRYFPCHFVLQLRPGVMGVAVGSYLVIDS